MNYSTSKENREDFVKFLEPIPVILIETSIEDEEFCIWSNGKCYEYEKLQKGCWIYIEYGGVCVADDSNDFFQYYKPCDNQESVSIEYDKDLMCTFLSCKGENIAIDKTEIATIERVLEALEIPYKERIGELFRFNKEISDNDNG